MKANRIEYLIREGDFAFSDEFGQLLQEVYTAIFAVCWPAGSNRFILCDKKNGNGVTPIKEGFLEALREESWECEQRISLVSQINCLEGPDTAASKDNSIVQTVEQAVVGDVWREAERKAEAVLEQYTLQDLCDKCDARQQLDLMYYI